jgi:hypothetical protein
MTIEKCKLNTANCNMGNGVLASDWDGRVFAVVGTGASYNNSRCLCVLRVSPKTKRETFGRHGQETGHNRVWRQATMGTGRPGLQ